MASANLYRIFNIVVMYHVLYFPLPSKHSSWWRRLEDVLKTSFAFIFKTSSRRLDQDEYVCLSLTSSEDVFKKSSRRLNQDQYIRLDHTSSRCLAKTSSRSFQDVFKTSCKNVFQTSSRRLANISSTRFQDVSSS